MTQKKVLYILPQPFFLNRGSSFRALATVEELCKLGFAVDLLCYSAGRTVQHENLTIYRIPKLGAAETVSIGPSFKKILLDIPLCIKAFWMCLTKRYDILHGVEEAGILATFLGKIFRKPYIFDMHSWMSEQLENHKFIKSKLILNLFKKLELYCMRNSAGIITVGLHMTELLKSMVPHVPAYTLNDLPIDFPAKSETSLVDKFKREYVEEAEITLLYTGNFHSYQGIDLLLSSFAQFKQLASDKFTSKLLLVGGGAGEQATVDTYRELVKTLKIEKDVVFCGEHPVESMPAFIDCADLLVSPRVSGNNVPLKIYSYLAAAKLIVATNISSHTQILNDQNSILAEPTPKEFAKSLYESVVNLCPDKAKLLKMNAGQAGLRDVRLLDFSSTLRACYGILGETKFVLAAKVCWFI